MGWSGRGRGGGLSAWPGAVCCPGSPEVVSEHPTSSREIATSARRWRRTGITLARAYTLGCMRASRHDSPELRWEMVTRDAHPLLGRYVREYTGYTETSAEPLLRREVPSADVTLVLSPGSRLRMPHLDEWARHTSFVAALHDRYALVAHDGFQEGVQVRLTPLGAHALFGLPMHELTNRV